jgi:hypothetical protein
MRHAILVAALLAALALVPCPALSCSYCSSVQQAPTIRQEAGQPYAKVILYGTLANPDNGKATELQIKSVLRSDPALGDKKTIPLTKFVPADPKNPPKFLVFSDIDKDKFDTYRGVPLKTEEGLEYVKKVLELDPKDRTGNLLFFFNYLEHPDTAVAQDAFLELAKAGDKEIGQLAGKLSAEKLRKWLFQNKDTPQERLGLYAFLLGSCGNDNDAAELLKILKNPDERMQNAYDGILGGYIHLKPKEGWDLAVATLKDGRQPFQQRLSVVRALQFYHGWQPAESRPHIVKGLAAMLEQGELADVAIEDLRRWEMWDLTTQVLGVYGKKGYNGPIMRRTIVRYALCCKDNKDAAQFLEARRKDDPEIVKDEEEALKFDK